MKNSKRYLALDVFRGITIASMITVNNPGSWSHIYAPMRHAAWHGCTPTDLIFPFFLFIVGVSMFFSFSRYNHVLSGDAALRIAKRTLLILAIGLFLNSFPQWMIDYSNLRILGVLQRIALAYGIGSYIVLAFPKKQLPYISILILLLYWVILYIFGGSDPYSLEENAALVFDKAILQERHLYKGFGIPFDPEGLLSTVPTVASVIIGYLVGGLIRQGEKAVVVKKLIILGIIGIAIGFVWGFVLPINKPLWTSSYVIYTAGWACLFLSMLIWLIDMKGYTRWTPFFVVFGMNPLFIFAFAALWAKTLIRIVQVPQADGGTISGYTWLYSHIFVPIGGLLNGSLLFALAHIFFFWLIGYILYKKKIFIKV